MNFSTTPSTAVHGPIDELVDRFDSGSPTLLAVWAHPDDESYLGAGLMAEVAARGGRVVSVTATLGEHGTDDPDREPPHRLAARRHDELFEALGHLRVNDARVLGFRDGACDRVPDRLGADIIGALVDEVQPDLVVGFGADGVTGHPDHQALGRWTASAVGDRGDRVPLLTTTAGAVWPDDLIESMHQVHMFWPGYPLRRLEAPHWTVSLQRQRLDQKLTALHSHRSQIGPLQHALGPVGYRRLASIEAYSAANPAAASAMNNPPEALAA
jgi:LmbE family N-acetylglucosaminyl deacetylase